MSLIECPEPDWDEALTNAKPLHIEEIKFDLDDHLKEKIRDTYVTVNENVSRIDLKVDLLCL